MADNIFDQIHAETQPSGNVFDQLHAESQPKDEPGFVHGVVKGSSLLSAIRHPIDTFTQLTGIDEAKEAKDAWDRGDKYTAAAKAMHVLMSNPATRIAGSLVDTSKDQVKKAVNAFHQGDYDGVINHGGAALIPLFAPAVNGRDLIKEGQEDLAKEPGFDQQSASERWHNTINNPKVREGLGNAVGNAFDFVAPKVISEGAGIVKAKLPPVLQDSAEAQYNRVLSPSGGGTKGNKIRTERVVPELIDRGVKATSLKNLGETVAGKMESAGDALDKTYQTLPADAGISLDKVVQRMKDAATEDATVLDNKGNPASPSAAHERALEHVKDIADRLPNFAVPDPVTGELKIPIDKARDLRQAFDNVSKQGGRFDGRDINDQSVTAAHGIAGDAIRQGIGEEFPEVAKDNAEFQLWSDANRVIGDTLQRKVGQTKGLGRTIAKLTTQGAGAVLGGKLAGWEGAVGGAAAGRLLGDAVEGAVSGTGFNTVSAILKNKLAEAIAGGRVGEISYYAKKIEAAKAQAAQNAATPPPLPNAAQPVQQTPPLPNAAPVAPAPTPVPSAVAPPVFGQTPQQGQLPLAPAQPPPIPIAAPIQVGQTAPAEAAPIIPQGANLTPEERIVEKSFADKVQADPKATVDEYRSRFTRPTGTVEISADNARELSPDYAASNDARSAYSRAVHEPASYIAKKVYEEELAKPAPEGMDNRVVFTAGGTGAGKTVGAKVLPGENPPQILYDTNSNNFESAQSKVEAALNAGKDVSIRYVHRTPEAAFESMIDRAGRMGRTVPIQSHIETHTGAPEALLKLADKYKDDPRVDINVIDNTGGKDDVKPGTIDMLRGLDYTGLEQRLKDALEARRIAGTVSPEIYRGILGPTNGADDLQPEVNNRGGAGTTGEVEAPAKSAKPSVPVGAGSTTEVIIPGENRSIPATYRLRELDDVQSSHNGNTFQSNPNYGLTNDRDYTRPENQGKVVEGALPNRFKPALHVTDNPDASNGPILVDSSGNAIGGNGRKMMLDRVYSRNPQGAQEYRDMMTQKAAQFGIKPEDVAAMKRPVLVREIADKDLGNAQNAVTDFNKTGTASLRPSERAIADSRRVSTDTLNDVASRLEQEGPDATLGSILSGRAGSEVLGKLIDDGVISPQERAAYQSKGLLTEDGKTRISKLLLGRFFRDPAQLDSLSVPMRNKLERLAAPLARTEVGGESWSLTPKVQEAMDLIEESKAHGGNIDDLMNQGGLFNKEQYSPDAVKIAKALQTSTQRSLVQAVNEYAQDASYAGKGDTLFGEKPEPGESLSRALDGLERKTATPKDISEYAAKKGIDPKVAKQEFEQAGFEIGNQPKKAVQ